MDELRGLGIDHPSLAVPRPAGRQRDAQPVRLGFTGQPVAVIDSGGGPGIAELPGASALRRIVRLRLLRRAERATSTR